ncbi:MAG: apolipoprotein N-acyltransferase [Clostridia bacterium]|nr:apolipoprotein N-acyltransferase [Clostridia bacterium]
MKIKGFFTRPVILLILSAILSALPLTFSFLYPLSWISFVPFFYVLVKHSGNKLRCAIGRGFLFGFIYHICIYYWFLWFYPLDYVDFTKTSSIAVVALAWFGISAVHGALWCIPFICCHIAKKVSNSCLFLSFAAIVSSIAAQKLTQLGELSFPWARVSLGQYKATALIQSASLFGIDGVDMLILGINAAVAICIIYPPKKRTIVAAVAAVVFLSNLGFGLIRINTTSNDKSLTVMTVQASVPQDEKWASDGDATCYDIYSRLTKENITEQVDLVLWPESAVPKVYKSEKSLKQYKKLSKEIGVPILAGVLMKTDSFSTNNASLIDQNEVVASYSKRQLVPFGEYMPYQKTFSKIFPFLADLNIIEDDYISGDSTAIMQVDGGAVGNIICFESIYPSLTRQSVLDGAELMIEITNDSWLKDSPAMQQHLAHGVFRSIENGRYLVRSANSGISAVVDSRGNVIHQLDANKQGVITDTVYFCDKETLYTKTGDILFPICAVVVIIWYIVLLIKYLINKHISMRDS